MKTPSEKNKARPTPSDDQLDLFASLETPEPPAALPGAFSRQLARQLALGFLLSLGYEAAAPGVPARFRKYRTDAAGFRRRKSGRHTVFETALVMLYENLDQCVADCSGRETRLKQLADLSRQREAMEAGIRRDEPDLGSTDDLFSDFRTWNYAASRNRSYRALCRRIEKLRSGLCRGSRLERIRATGVADLCYLALPEGVELPGEVAAGWGIVRLKKDRSFEVLKMALPQVETTDDGRRLLVANIAVASAAAARFAAGVELHASGKLICRRPPRRRGKL